VPRDQRREQRREADPRALLNRDLLDAPRRERLGYLAQIDRKLDSPELGGGRLSEIGSAGCLKSTF